MVYRQFGRRELARRRWLRLVVSMAPRPLMHRYSLRIFDLSRIYACRTHLLSYSSVIVVTLLLVMIWYFTRVLIRLRIQVRIELMC